MTSRSREAGPRKDERTGTWWFVIDLGLGPEGKRKQARRRGFKRKSDAQEELDRLRVRVHEQTFVNPSRITLADYLEEWLAGLEVAGRRPSTMESYRRNLRLHVYPRLGGMRLQALGPLDLDRLYAELLTEGNRKVAGGLSPRVVRYIHTILRAALADATRKGLVLRNVGDAASPPSAKSTKPAEMAWWTPEQLRTFLDQVADDRLLPLFRLAAMTGMRRGEVCGLRWADLDLEAGRVNVRRQLLVINHEPTFAEHPKSDRGRRTIDLDPGTVTILRRHRKAQLEERVAVGPGYADADLVFAGPDGAPLHPELVAGTFERRVARSGLPRLRFHDLRHTHAAHLIAAGRDSLAISRRLGHASTSFTLDRYGHLMPKADSEAASAVAALVDGR